MRSIGIEKGWWVVIITIVCLLGLQAVARLVRLPTWDEVAERAAYLVDR